MQRIAVAAYISGFQGAAGRSDFFPITETWIEDELIARRYSGELLQGDMAGYEDAVEIRFDNETQAMISAAVKNVEVRDRLGAVGVLVFAGLIGLICSSGFIGILSRRGQRRDQQW
jgi:hypothetical protein